MCAFVVLGLVFLYQAERLAWGTFSEMTYFALSGTYDRVLLVICVVLSVVLNCIDGEL